jgi:hypothetical protein
MVIGLVSYQRLLKLAEGKGLRNVLAELEPEIMADKESRRRTPRPPAPAGGISISVGSRRYNIPHPTISRWVSNGYIPVLLRTRYELFIQESRLAELAVVYQGNPGRGSWAVKQYIQNEKH